MSCCNWICSRKNPSPLRDVTIPQAVWAVATRNNRLFLKGSRLICYNTASGMSCCNKVKCLLNVSAETLQYRKRYELLQHWFNSKRFSTNVVTIPQAVWAVATWWKWQFFYIFYKLVTIPQAVWAVATKTVMVGMSVMLQVTIPQAVWAVATIENGTIKCLVCEVTIPQAVWAVATTRRLRDRINFLSLLQYRKRYELLQLTKTLMGWLP